VAPPYFLGQRQHAQDVAHRDLSAGLVHAAAERPDLYAGLVGAAQQLLRAERCLFGPILVFDSMTAARIAHVFPEQLAGARV
jgi:hypothetical protein